MEYFEKLTNWAEMADWLQKLARHIETYQTLYLPCKKEIAKRLNQCLNIPNLPIGIHRTNMIIYDLVFEILSKRKSAIAKNIAIFSFGLFSMFKRAQLEIKHSIIGLFEKYYLPLKEQLVPMLNGIIGCLLSGMNDSETEMKAKILKLLSKINSVVGDHLYVSALWQVLLKNSQTQLQCIKAIFYKFEKSKDLIKNLKSKKHQIEEEDENNPNNEDEKIQIPQKSQSPILSNISNNIVERSSKFENMISHLQNHDNENGMIDFFPHTVMVKNAINKCLRNPNVHVVKGILDLMIGFISFKEDHDTSVRRRVFQFLFNQKEITKVDLSSQHSEFILSLLNNAYNFYLTKSILDEQEINLVFDIIEIANSILSINAYNFIQFVYVLGYENVNAYNAIICQRLKKFIIESSQYIEEIIESLALVIHENSQKIAREISEGNMNDSEKRIEKMFIIEFVVKVIINESDISITKKREYMLLMLRSLLSMFNLFEGGVIFNEKKSFVRLLDIIDQILILLKNQFLESIDEFKNIWLDSRLFIEVGGKIAISESLNDKIKVSSALLQSSNKNFDPIIEKMILNKNNENMKFDTSVICESQEELKKLDEKRKSIMPSQNLIRDIIEDIVQKEFITEEIFENECRVVMNLFLKNSDSLIISENFNKILFILVKMEEFTLKGVITHFNLKNLILSQEARSTNLRGKTHKSRITRFTNLSIPSENENEQSLFKLKSVFKANEYIIKKESENNQQKNFSKKNEPEVLKNEKIIYPKWLLACLKVITISQHENLIFNCINFMYSLIDWDIICNFPLVVKYNSLLYKQKSHFQKDGLFCIVVSKLFDLMEVNAYKNVALNYFLNFVIENCSFVIEFVKNKLRFDTARDFRQIAGLWKHPNIMKSSMFRKLLEESVFDMLDYSSKEDPLIRNYFRNWLQFSEKNFIIIVNKILKKLYLHSNMKLVNKELVYNVLFNTQTFDKLLRLLQAVFSSGGNSFLNFVRKTEISEEFEVYDAEMNSLLNNFYSFDSKRYFSFIVKLMLCYLLASPNKEIVYENLNQTHKSNQEEK